MVVLEDKRAAWILLSGRQLERLLAAPERVEVRLEVGRHLRRHGGPLYRERIHRDVAVEAALGLWLGQLHRLVEAVDVRRRGDEDLHRVLGLYPLAARRRPAGAVVEAELYAVLLRLADRGLPALPPLVGERLRVRRQRLLSGHEHMRRAYAQLAHRLEVGCKALVRDAGCRPVVPRLEARLRRRVREILANASAGERSGDARRREKHDFIHRQIIPHCAVPAQTG